MFRFVDKLEGSIDPLLGGPTETVWIWFYFGMLFLPEGATDEAMGQRAIFLSQGPCHVKMVGSARATGGQV